MTNQHISVPPTLHEAYDDGAPCIHCGASWEVWSQSPMSCPRNVAVKQDCKSCKGKGESIHGGDGCCGGPFLLPCSICDGTGEHNEEKYREARIQGLRAAVANLTAAVERHRQDVAKRIEKLQDEVKGLEECLEKRKKELADLESGKPMPEERQSNEQK